MMNHTNVVKFISSSILAMFTAWFGEIGPLICILLICMIGDYITGLINAGISGTISSVRGIKGIAKKCYNNIKGNKITLSTAYRL